MSSFVPRFQPSRWGISSGVRNAATRAAALGATRTAARAIERTRESARERNISRSAERTGNVTHYIFEPHEIIGIRPGGHSPRPDPFPLRVPMPSPGFQPTRLPPYSPHGERSRSPGVSPLPSKFPKDRPRDLFPHNPHHHNPPPIVP